MREKGRDAAQIRKHGMVEVLTTNSRLLLGVEGVNVIMEASLDILDHLSVGENGCLLIVGPNESNQLVNHSHHTAIL